MLIVYGAEWCKFCKKAKDFLDTTHVEFQFVDIDTSIEQSMILIEKNLTTIPQIFEGDKLIGGYSDLTKYCR